MTREELFESLIYEPETGRFYWAVTRGRAKMGTLAGYTVEEGRRLISVNGNRLVPASHLVWLAETGDEVPEGMEIDHEDGDPSDDRFGNLRLVTHQQNMMNRKLSKANKSGVTGVHFRPHLKKKPWLATLHVNGKVVLSQSCTTMGEAVGLRKAAEKEHFGEFARI